MSPCFNCRAWQRMSKPELSNLNAQMQHLKLWNFRRGGYMFLGAQKTKTSQPAVQQQHCFFVKLFCRASGNMLFRVNWLVVNGASLPVVFFDGIQDVNISQMNPYYLLMWTLLTSDPLDGKKCFHNNGLYLCITTVPVSLHTSFLGNSLHVFLQCSFWLWPWPVTCHMGQLIKQPFPFLVVTRLEQEKDMESYYGLFGPETQPMIQ